jgi:hypothetical protein
MSNYALFDNLNDVVGAYKNMGVGPWAILSGRTLNFSYSGDSLEDGASELAEYLDMLAKNGRPITYTLQVYADLPGGKVINNKTPHTASFGFTLLGDQVTWAGNAMGAFNGMTVGSVMAQGGNVKAILDELKALKLEQAEIKEKLEDLDDQDGSYGLGKIGQALNHPTIAAILQKLAGKFSDMVPQGPAPVISGVEQNEKKIVDSLRILCDGCPDFPDILAKLALLIQRKPADFNVYAGHIRAMTV